MNEIDFKRINSKHKLYDLGVVALVAMNGGKEAIFEDIKNAVTDGKLTKKQAFDLRMAIRQSIVKTKKRTITLSQYENETSLGT